MLCAALFSSLVLVQSTPPPAPREEKVKFAIEIPLEDGVTRVKRTVSFDIVLIPGGECRMGSRRDEPGRKDNDGTIDEKQGPIAVKPFWMAKHEAVWEDVELVYMSDEVDADTQPTIPSHHPPDRGWGKGRKAAMSIQWRTALCFCRLLSKKTGKKFRLPTEAEWEYACRAGSKQQAPEPLGDFAWFKDNSGSRNQEVGKKKPNAFGLHDMLGNVWEYCQEIYQPEPGVVKPPAGAAEHVCDMHDRCFHVIRGGSWNDPASELRAASRTWVKTDWNVRDPQGPRGVSWLTDGPFVGFRVVRDLEPGEK